MFRSSKTQNTSTKTKQGKKKNNYNSTPANTNTDQPFRGGNRPTQSRGGRGGGTSRGRGSKPYTPNKGKKSKKGSSD